MFDGSRRVAGLLLVLRSQQNIRARSAPAIQFNCYSREPVGLWPLRAGSPLLVQAGGRRNLLLNISSGVVHGQSPDRRQYRDNVPLGSALRVKGAVR